MGRGFIVRQCFTIWLKAEWQGLAKWLICDVVCNSNAMGSVICIPWSCIIRVQKETVRKIDKKRTRDCSLCLVNKVDCICQPLQSYCHAVMQWDGHSVTQSMIESLNQIVIMLTRALPTDQGKKLHRCICSLDSLPVLGKVWIRFLVI